MNSHEDALNINAGDYSDHEYNYKYGPVMNIDLPKAEEDYPSAEQLDMYFRWIDIFYDVEPGELKDEDEVTQEVLMSLV
ncbi:hypothetical protein [Jeotgalibacillus marinus]|uniref:Uncharacterized protein n=1 Tax=Jeotgalibacillus marinus TaxID=86667 RepID=A0ABV3PZT1_9BACL